MGSVEPDERNDTPPHPEETVDQLETAAFDDEAPEWKELMDNAEERDDSTEPAFDQDLDVEDLSGQSGQGSRATTEPSG